MSYYTCKCSPILNNYCLLLDYNMRLILNSQTSSNEKFCSFCLEHCILHLQALGKLTVHDRQLKPLLAVAEKSKRMRETPLVP